MPVLWRTAIDSPRSVGLSSSSDLPSLQSRCRPCSRARGRCDTSARGSLGPVRGCMAVVLACYTHLHGRAVVTIGCPSGPSPPPTAQHTTTTATTTVRSLSSVAAYAYAPEPNSFIAAAPCTSAARFAASPSSRAASPTRACALAHVGRSSAARFASANARMRYACRRNSVPTKAAAVAASQQHWEGRLRRADRPLCHGGGDGIAAKRLHHVLGRALAALRIVGCSGLCEV